MSLGRLVVIEGPDLGVEFPIPNAGGEIGRGDGSAVQLSDLAVSRRHCSVESRGGTVTLVDAGSRNRTVVNGASISEHALVAGDEIHIGKTRLAYLPPDEADGPGQRVARPSRVTMEIGSGELLREVRASVASIGDQRAQRHLAAIARLGDALRSAHEREPAARIACEVAVGALEADRAFLLIPDAAGRLVPVGSAIASDDPDGAHYEVSDVFDRVVQERKAIAFEPAAGESGRTSLAAPLSGADGEPSMGLLLVDRRPGREGATWDPIDLMAAGCISHLVSAALEGVRARSELARENRELHEKLGGGWDFVGQSPAARRVLEFVGKVGPSDATVLLGGESGSGKEMVSRAIHKASRRADQPFIAVNCAALTETLLESELFGHEKGAFTGATERKLGRFELADKGTLFLDEVGELSLNCQTKFLRVLEEQVFERVGGQRPIRTDVRVVAATNRDLADMVRRGQFREDLYYRLSVIHTVVPPLRARPEDIPVLAHHFLERLRNQVPRRIEGFADRALRALSSHPWPGNVRELRNAVEHAIVLGSGTHIDIDALPPHIAAAGSGTSTVPPTPAAGLRVPPGHGQPVAVAPGAAASLPPRVTMPPAPYPPAQPVAVPAPPAPVAPAAPSPPKSLRELEREGIIAALESTGGNKAQAAQVLQIDRSTLYKKIKDYGIEV